MPDALDSLILDFLEWVGKSNRTYKETLETWKTSCPKLPVWEEALQRGLVETQSNSNSGAFVRLTAKGTETLKNQRPGNP
jgi:hypothetical protein